LLTMDKWCQWEWHHQHQWRWHTTLSRPHPFIDTYAAQLRTLPPQINKHKVPKRQLALFGPLVCF
jgi:hypothetical protein